MSIPEFKTRADMIRSSNLRLNSLMYFVGTFVNKIKAPPNRKAGLSFSFHVKCETSDENTGSSKRIKPAVKAEIDLDPR